MKKTSVTVRMPAPLPAEIKCPICEGNKCKVCDKTGKITLKVDARVPIQRTDIVRYVYNNQQVIASEITRLFGLNPHIETNEIINIEDSIYEIVQISSIGGCCWVVWNMKELEPPQYFTDYQKLIKFKAGVSE
tara:strand:+ start:7430 stop:7828 length:399 start_codon:yes stop_codon:yes gene_type:complete